MAGGITTLDPGIGLFPLDAPTDCRAPVIGGPFYTVSRTDSMHDRRDADQILLCCGLLLNLMNTSTL